jgi:uncharacterized protein Yka (UPF0111/DUF47 family)
MKKEDLTRIKYIGASRLKKLNENGITTIEQLRQTPVEELAKISSIGEYYSIRIKDAAAAFFAREKKAVKETTDKILQKPHTVAKRTKRALEKLTNRLNGTKEKLKPLWKKKYLTLYISFKKQSNKLIKRIQKIEIKSETLSDKKMEKIIKRSKALNQLLKTEGKKPRKKAFKKITREIRSFSDKLKNTRA